MRPIVVWFRRDLRTDDHAALWRAAQTGVPIVPLFIVDRRLIAELPSDGTIFDFQAACLSELADRLAYLGAPLCIRYGEPTEVFHALFNELSVAVLYYNRDYEPYARERDRAVEALARTYGVTVRSFKDHVLVEPWEVATADGKPFVMYTPFFRAWSAVPKPEPFGEPEHLRGVPGLRSDPIPKAVHLGKPATIARWAVDPGMHAAHKRWERFRSGGLLQYHKSRDFPALEEGSSRMSPYLRFGAISIRRLYWDAVAYLQDPRLSAEERTAIERFIAELAWREFFQHVLWHFPDTPRRSFRPLGDAFPWENNEHLFRAWSEGRTGYPLVDAAMRELNETGYMHNRVRMVVASFLVKDLHIDWRWGERYFRSKLLDGDLASNVGNWQWAASVGVDTRPLRIFNPIRQSRRYDPDGTYIRRWVPELSELPATSIHEPWRSGRPGTEYPHPIVNHTERKRLFERIYTQLRSRSATGELPPSGRDL